MKYRTAQASHQLRYLLLALTSALCACGGGAASEPPTTSSAGVAPSLGEPLVSAVAAASSTDGAASAAAAASAASAAAQATSTGAVAAATAAGANLPSTTTPPGDATPGSAATGIVGSSNTNTTSASTAGTPGAAPALDPAAKALATGSVPSDTTIASSNSSTQPVVAAATVAPPVVFNAPLSSAPGDVISLQGENFGINPAVHLVNASGSRISTLSIVSTHGTGAVTARLPNTATGALIVQVDNGQSLSAPIKLNAAKPYHLDAMQISGGGQFRLFGRSLLVPGYTPTVTVDGLPATLNAAKSDEHMLVLTAPATLKANSKAVIVVDNKNGSGPATLDRTIDAVPGQGTDVFGLGVGWGDAFSSIATRVVNAATDSRLSKKVVCDGNTDNSTAIQDAIKLTASLGGGVVQLPAGTCTFRQGVGLASKVVLRGAGKAQTTLRYDATNLNAHAFWGKSLDLLGLANFTLQFVQPSETLTLQGSSRAFIANVAFQLNGGVHMFVQSNTNIAITGSDITQPVNAKLRGPVFMGGNAGFSFTANAITFAHGSPSIPNVSDAHLAGNRITRDVRNAMNAASVVHSLAMDFAHRVAVVGNTFDVLGGPITNKTRNDGETLLTEGGGANRTENAGTVSSATATTLTDNANTINVTPFTTGVIPPNYGVAIVGGKGAGQTRRVTAYAGKTLSVDSPWAVTPDTTSRYATFVWGLEKALIKGNTLKDNPRGIWIYNTAAREVDIVGNTILEGGGIYVRADQLASSKFFTPIYGLRIANNTISNTTRQWSSTINLNFTRRDQTDFGYAHIAHELRQNRITANSSNLIMTQELKASSEGYEATMLGEGSAQSLALSQVRMVGLVFQGNNCKGCNRLINIGTAVYGSAIDANTLSP